MKFNNNGKWQDVSLKVLDTLPIGAEINYSGDTIPEGWEVVDDYSTEEINTGERWIDSKPIYRKIFTGTRTITNQEIGTITNFKKIVSVKGNITTQNGTISQMVGGYTNSDNYSHIIITYPTVILYTPNAWNNSTYEIVIEYTKTTD